MDDLIIIILTLVIAVVGIIGQIKKKKQAQSEVNGTENNTSGNIWSFLDDIVEQPMQMENKAEPEEVKFMTEEKVKQQEYSFIAEKKGQPSAEKTKSLKKEIKENIKDEKKEKISESFSLKKAVIYSEILNRKYT